MNTLHATALHWGNPVVGRLTGWCVWRKFFDSWALDVMMNGMKERQHRLGAEHGPRRETACPASLRSDGRSLSIRTVGLFQLEHAVFFVGICSYIRFLGCSITNFNGNICGSFAQSNEVHICHYQSLTKKSNLPTKNITFGFCAPCHDMKCKL